MVETMAPELVPEPKGGEGYPEVTKALLDKEAANTKISEPKSKKKKSTKNQREGHQQEGGGGEGSSSEKKSPKKSKKSKKSKRKEGKNGGTAAITTSGQQAAPTSSGQVLQQAKPPFLQYQQPLADPAVQHSVASLPSSHGAASAEVARYNQSGQGQGLSIMAPQQRNQQQGGGNNNSNPSRQLYSKHEFVSFGSQEREQLDGAADIILEMEQNEPEPALEKPYSPEDWRRPSQQSMGVGSYRTAGAESSSNGGGGGGGARKTPPPPPSATMIPPNGLKEPVPMRQHASANQIVAAGNQEPTAMNRSDGWNSNAFPGEWNNANMKGSAKDFALPPPGQQPFHHQQTQWATVATAAAMQSETPSLTWGSSQQSFNDPSKQVEDQQELQLHEEQGFEKGGTLTQGAGAKATGHQSVASGSHNSGKVSRKPSPSTSGSKEGSSFSSSTSEDYDDKEEGDELNMLQPRQAAPSNDDSWKHDSGSVESSVISDITFETLKQQHMMMRMVQSNQQYPPSTTKRRPRGRSVGRASSARMFGNPKDAIMEEYAYDQELEAQQKKQQKEQEQQEQQEQGQLRQHGMGVGQQQRLPPHSPEKWEMLDEADDNRSFSDAVGRLRAPGTSRFFQQQQQQQPMSNPLASYSGIPGPQSRHGKPRSIMKKSEEEKAAILAASMGEYGMPPPGQRSLMPQNDPQHSQELLTMYLLSMGTDPVTAQTLAANFSSHQQKQQQFLQQQSVGFTAQPYPGMHPQMAPNNYWYDPNAQLKYDGTYANIPGMMPGAMPPGSQQGFTYTMADKKAAEAMGFRDTGSVRNYSAPPVVMGPDPHNPAMQFPPRGPTWERFDQPGAVQMEGRAYGARYRPQSAAQNAVVNPVSPTGGDGDSTVGERSDEEGGALDDSGSAGITGHLVEAKAVGADDYDMDDIVTAEAQPLSLSNLWKEKSVRRIFLLGILILLVIVIITVSLILSGTGAVSKGDEPELFGFPTVSPTMFPTRIESDFEQVLLQFSPDVQTPGTPQRKALAWLSTFDQSGVESNGVRFVQRFILATLFYATNGESWKDREDWLDPVLHECDWGQFTIACTDSKGEQRKIKSLNLVNSGLVGRLPPELGFLEELQVLNLAGNNIIGTIPPDLFNAAKLSHLELKRNLMNGPIPPEVAQASLLENLDLSLNNFNSSLPDSLYDLIMMTSLDLSFNNIAGVWNEEGMWQMKELVKLDLQSNIFTGKLATNFENNPKLQFFHVDNNQFSGTLPVFSGFLLSRQELTISRNLLTGTIPSVPLDQLSSLQLGGADRILLRKIDLSGNQFTGTIPLLVGAVPSIEWADLSNNSFTGEFPVAPSVPLWNSIKTLIISGNQLTGPIPTEFPNRDGIELLDFSDNLFSSGIPKTWSGFDNLEYLSVRDNEQLGGSIPSELALPSLKTLELSNCALTGSIPAALMTIEPSTFHLSNNNLIGTIPNEIGAIAALTSLRLDNNNLRGTIPPTLGLLEFLHFLVLDNNALTGFLAPELGLLQGLEEFSVVGNDQLQGQIPESFCTQLPELSAEDIGCRLTCTCCDKRNQECEALSIP